MFYVLRTHGQVDNHWGFTCVSIAKTKKEAKEICKRLLNAEPSRDKYVITKAISYFKLENWNIGEKEVC